MVQLHRELEVTYRRLVTITNAVRLVASASSGVGLGFTANASFRRALCP
jgi:hypothetical protein